MFILSLSFLKGIGCILGKYFDRWVRSYSVTPENSPEFFDIINDLYFTENMQSQAAFAQHSEINRLDHVRSVAYLTFLYCREHSLDIRTATRAAILHDLTYYDWHDGDWSHRPHGYRHPAFAAKNAKELDPTLNEKGRFIILRHMWPLTVVPPKSKEGWAVSLIDKYCATREMMRGEIKYFARRFEEAKRLSEKKNAR